MLKALELAGFKSFAERTRWEFPRGITVIVGPNGSGKSNVVDAIRWVLGEQSVKSLRGKEMTDVIFNGATGRRPQNVAEVTLTFDNENRRFALDTPEIQVTRRVFRSGEAEYLLNRQVCRLKDIRDLFAGTGVATEAYSIIEQGKVDVLLQSSPRERRMIFEEAAGISRFKAKKIESLRRIERVEQNLLRLSDIVDEVENRLKSVRLQAGKAQKYQELADRLQQLRTQSARADWRKLSGKLGEIDQETNALRDEIATANVQADSADAQVTQHDGHINDVEELLRSHENRLHENRQQIAVLESTAEHERTRSADLDEELLRHRKQAAALSSRAGDMQQLMGTTETELAGAYRQLGEHRDNLSTLRQSVAEAKQQIEELRQAREQHRNQHRERTRTVNSLTKDLRSLESQVAAALAVAERDRQRLAELHSSKELIAAESELLRERLGEVIADFEASELRQATAQDSVSTTRHQLAQQQQELAEWRQLHAAAAERTRVLEEWERRLEGIHAGVKELLVRAQTLKTGPLKAIRGMVADLLRVPVEMAPLIDIALGDKAQHLVINSGFDLGLVVEGESPRLSGRVGFLRLDWKDDVSGTALPDLTGQPGVFARADRFVETEETFQPLVERLLGRTWIVDRFEHAVALANGIGRGANFVTRKGEYLTTDGGLVTGPRNAAIGLISRRSELRALKSQLVELESKIAERATRTAELDSQLNHEDDHHRQLTLLHQRLTGSLGELRQQVRAADERLLQLATETQHVEAEAKQATVQADEINRQAVTIKAQLAEEDAHLTRLQAALDQYSTLLVERDAAHQQVAQLATTGEVELAKSEQRVADLVIRRQQYEKDHHERQQAIEESQRALSQTVERREQTERNILAAAADLAKLYLHKESFASDATSLHERREVHRVERASLFQESQRIRNRVRRIEEKLHKKELAAGEIRHELTTLTDRIREDYGIEVASLEETSSSEEVLAREEVDREIADLRQRLNMIGGVNLEALNELDELEKRFATLSSQFQDLTSAKQSLEQIIHKINADSRRLFTETLEMVRGHFQELFRKLFGGGQADIVLDKGVDILESGIEIVARPPGKELRSISLMSGGEKTLTCVALLLSIFRSRPSPFCILDEVDAALDEANIGRFVEVLKEFLTWTQFVVVTHSKKTMTCADTLYGVTMQESGVSKRVSVRFEDVTETGDIRIKNPLDKSPDDTQAA